MCPARSPRNNEIVVLVHGLFFNRYLMKRCFGEFLQTAHYDVLIYDYRSSLADLPSLAADYQWRLHRRLAKLPSGTRVNFVTHSMGGLLTLGALNTEWAGGLWPEQLELGRIVLMAPPFRGSPKADYWVKRCPRLSTKIKPLQDLCSGAEILNSVPDAQGRLNGRVGVIAASRDRAVKLDAAQIPGAEMFVVDAGHNSMMNNILTRRACLEFLKNGSFEALKEI